MEPQEYEKMYELEDKHWWFVSKRRLINNFLNKIKFNNKPYILDLGCGTGANLQSFCKYGKAVGMDISPLAIKFSSARECPYLVRGSVNNIPFKDNVFSAVTLLDVLYHKMVKEDKEALSGVYRIMGKGGKLIITDSALKILKGPHDAAVHGKCRYSKKDLKELVQNAGFKIERLTYINFLVFPFVFIIRMYKNIFKETKHSSDLKEVHPVLNCILLGVQKIEGILLKFINLPIGSSIFCIAVK